MSEQRQEQNSEAEEVFFAAVKARDLDQVRKCLEVEPELVNAFDASEFGGTSIHLAIHRDDKETIALLLEKGADINLKSDFAAGAWSAVQLALSSAKDELADFLVGRGAEIGPHEAAGLGDLELLESLIDENPRCVHAAGGDGCVPLHFARTPEVADLLLSHGADLEARCEDHHSTPTEYLCTSRPAVARHLMDLGAEWNLFTVIMAGDEPRFREALQGPGALEMRIDETHFPKHPETEAMSILYFTVGWNTSPLHAAAKANRPDFIRALLAAGMEIETRADYDDCTALHMAAWWDKVEAARCLIEEGADIEVNTGEIHNTTAASWAIVSGSAHVLELLLVEHRAEIRDYYLPDAIAAAKGEFRVYRASTEEKYEKALAILNSRLSELE